MNARHAAAIRAGIHRGRLTADLASLIRSGHYPIRRHGASKPEWEAVSRTVQRRLRLVHGWTVTAGHEQVTVRRRDAIPSTLTRLS